MLEDIKHKTFKNHTISMNCQQKFKVLFIGSIDFAKITLASLLSIFVPQECEGKVCSLYDNFSELSNYNIFVVILNFVLFGLFLYTYIYEIRREFFMIKHFDTEYGFPDDNLSKIIIKYEDINISMNKFNLYYHNLCLLLYFMFIFNWITSAILVFHYFYLDKTTITAMIMNFLLVFSKIHKGYLVSTASKNSLYVSSFLPENFIYNIMDKEKYGSPYDMTIHIEG